MEQGSHPSGALHNGWTAGQVRELLLSMISDLKEAQEQRFVATQQAGDQRHESAQAAIKIAFTAAETAMQTAFNSQKVAVDAALAAQKEAVITAQAAADRAGIKAEMYSEKRFDLVAEKIDNNMAALLLKTDANFKELSAKIEALSTASTSQSSQKLGLQGGWMNLVVGISTLSTIVLLLLRVLGK
jgi:histidinol phosphatase-like enzyme